MSYDSQTSTTLINKLRKDVDSLTLKVAVLTDSKTSGTSGGTGVATTWSTRTLNTIQSDPNGLIIDLTGNTFKLAAGSYQVRNISAFLHTGHTRMRLYDVTNAVVIGYSVSVEVSNQANLYLDMNVRIIPHKDTIYRIEYYITASGSDHLGVAASLPSIDEIYSVCEITRLDTGMTKPLGTGGLQGPQGPAGPTGPSGPPGPSGGGVTSVNVSGGATGLSTSGGPITTSGTITLGGIVAVTAGGTGAITAPAALTSLGAYPASNPNGYNVGTVTNVTVTAANGVTASVATSTTTPAISLGLGAITPTSVASTGTVTGTNLSGTHTGTSSGTNTGDQTITLTGPVTGTGTGSFATTITAQAVTYSKIQLATGVKRLLGSDANFSDITEIVLGSNLAMAGNVLSATGSGTGTVTSVDGSGSTTGLTFTGGPIITSGTLTLGGTLALTNGGTGAVSAAAALTSLGAYPAANPSGFTSNAGTVTSADVSGGTTGLTTTGGPINASGTITLAGTLAVANGGTGAITAPLALTSLGAYPANNPNGYTANAGTVTNVSVSGSANISVATGSTTPVISQVGASVTQNGFMSAAQATKLDGITTGASVTSVAVSGGTTGLTTSGGPITTFGTITMDGTLAVTNGGTGAITAPLALASLGAYPANNPNGYTNNTGTVTSVDASGGTTGLSFTGGPIIGSGTLIMNGTVNADSGGTGHTAPTVNGLLLIGDAVDEEWDKATLTAGTGITITNGQGSITIAATGSGSGDVVGPVSSNTNALAKFSNTTGKLIGEAGWNENGGDLYGPAGNLNQQNGFIYIPADTGGAPSTAPAQAGTLADRAAMYFDLTNDKLYVYNYTTFFWIPIN